MLPGPVASLTVYNTRLYVPKIHPSICHTDKFINDSLIEIIDSLYKVSFSRDYCNWRKSFFRYGVPQEGFHTLWGGEHLSAPAVVIGIVIVVLYIPWMFPLHYFHTQRQCTSNWLLYITETSMQSCFESRNGYVTDVFFKVYLRNFFLHSWNLLAGKREAAIRCPVKLNPFNFLNYNIIYHVCYLRLSITTCIDLFASLQSKQSASVKSPICKISCSNYTIGIFRWELHWYQQKKKEQLRSKAHQILVFTIPKAVFFLQWIR